MSRCSMARVCASIGLPGFNGDDVNQVLICEVTSRLFVRERPLISEFNRADQQLNVVWL
jgi:hypothetical protein